MPLGDRQGITIFGDADHKDRLIRIGLIADTHIPGNVKILPPHVKEAFQGADLILHAGDIYLSRVLDELETIAPVLAAHGNTDGAFPQDCRVSGNHVLSVNGLSLGLTHILDYPAPSGYPFDKVVEREFGQHVDIIVFGDTHVAMVERYNGILLVNPGSPTLPNNQLELGTVGLLEITGTTAEARIICLSELPIPFHRELIYY